MAKLKKATRKPTDRLKPTTKLKTKGNSEENCPVKADGNAEESGSPKVPEMLKPLEM